MTTLNPSSIRGVDEATALGLAALWNEAIPDADHVLGHQIAELEGVIDHAHTCDRDECEGIEIRHDDGDEDCACFACENAGLLTMAQDVRDSLAQLHGGTAAPVMYQPEHLFGLVSDYLYVHPEIRHRGAGTNWYRPWLLGPIYRLAAELADQAKAAYAAHMESS